MPSFFRIILDYEILDFFLGFYYNYSRNIIRFDILDSYFITMFDNLIIVFSDMS